VSIQTLWHAFVEKLEHIRHEVDPALHKDLDELAVHASALKTEAESVSNTAIHEAKAAAPFVAAVPKEVEKDVLTAAQSVEAVAPIAKDILK
jgi:hypothetical protein